MINAMRRILLSRVVEITRTAQHPITRVEETSFRRLISLVNRNNLSFSIIRNTSKTLMHKTLKETMSLFTLFYRNEKKMNLVYEG